MEIVQEPGLDNHFSVAGASFIRLIYDYRRGEFATTGGVEVPANTAAVVVAVISAGASLSGSLAVEISRRRSARRLQDQSSRQQEELEKLKRRLEAEYNAASKAEQASELMAKYQNPLLRSAFDLQSKIYNICRGFNGSRDPDYYKLNTLYVIAEFFGWLEIIRREIQFFDLDLENSTRHLKSKLDHVQNEFARTSQRRDNLYIFRGQQRAIGELMIIPSGFSGRSGPQRECIGYATFVAKCKEPEFFSWFQRLAHEIENLPAQRPRRFHLVQHALIDLIDHLDPDHKRFQRDREKI